MDTTQQDTPLTLVPPPPPPGLFGTKIPSSVTFGVGLLLFLLPFAELKCTADNKPDSSFMDFSGANISFTNTGVGIAFGGQWKVNIPVMAGLMNEKKDSMKEMNDNKPNNYALVALILAALGLGLSFMNGKVGASLNIVTGVLASAALIGLMLDLRKKLNTSLTEKGTQYFGATDKNPFSLSFTPWFYIAIVAFLVAAFFSFKRIQEMK